MRPQEPMVADIYFVVVGRTAVDCWRYMEQMQRYKVSAPVPEGILSRDALVQALTAAGDLGIAEGFLFAACHTTF